MSITVRTEYDTVNNLLDDLEWVNVSEHEVLQRMLEWFPEHAIIACLSEIREEHKEEL